MKVLVMMWGQFAFSYLLFAGALFHVTKGGPTHPEMLTTLGPAFGIMSLLLLAGMPFIRARVQGAQTLFGLMPSPPSGTWNAGLDAEHAQALMDTAGQKYRIGMLIGLAFCEAPVLFGFALGFSSGIPLVIAPFIVGGFLGLVLQFPTRDGIETVARALRASQPAQ
jgi:hypothetical protein